MATGICHVVAIPYPGRGHINPMMNLCNLILHRRPDAVISFVVTEEWLGFIRSEPKPENFQLCSIPNVIPSEVGRGKDFAGFLEAVYTKLEAPVESLLDRLEVELPKPSVIIHDTYLAWVVGLGNRRNIPAASFWTMSATVFSIFHHFDLLVHNGHYNVNLSERRDELVDYIPGVPPTRISDLPPPFYGNGQETMHRALEAFSQVSKAQYLLFTSVYELESSVINALKEKIRVPIYAIGPTVPYFNICCPNTDHKRVEPDEYIMKWLDAQPKGSVLYISQGSFLSVSSSQLDEIVAGVQESGVRYLWVARGDASRLQEGSGGNGLVVPWCNQLKVLCHSSVGGFWSHCGWNSTKEAVFAGVPMLTFPIFWDQIPNGKLITEDWKIGSRVKRNDQSLTTRGEVSRVVRKVMDPESVERKRMKRRAKELKEICRGAISEGGSADIDIQAFLQMITQDLIGFALITTQDLFVFVELHHTKSGIAL